MRLLAVAALLYSQLVNPVCSQGGILDLLQNIPQMIPPGLWDALQGISYGPCPRVATVPEFDPARYLGAWYSQCQTPSLFQPSDQGYRWIQKTIFVFIIKKSH